MRVSQTHIRIAKRGVIADEIIFHKKVYQKVSNVLIQMILRCEENRCTFLTLTKGYTPETSVYFFEGICYFLVFFVMKLSLLHLSKVQALPFYSPFIKRSEVLLWS